MDPNKELSSLTNSTNTERNVEVNRSSQGTPRELHAGQGDMNPNFPPNSWPNMLNQGSQSLYQDARPGRSAELTGENDSGAGSSGQSSSKVKLNSNGGPDGAATAGSSKSSLNINNGMDIVQAIFKIEVDLDKYNIGPLARPQLLKDTDDKNIIRESRKRPSSLKLNRPNMDDDSSSLSDYSLGSEDGCIYTYRGGEHLADLPSSFFSLDMGLPADRLALPNYAAPQAAGNAREGGSRASSPDMDFLEMDFDPGPSNEGDSGEESAPNADLDAAMEMPEEVVPVRGPTPEKMVASSSKHIPVVTSGEMNINRPATSGGASSSHLKPGTSRGVSNSRPSQIAPRIVYGPSIAHVNARGDSILVRRTMSHCLLPVNYHLFGGEIIPPRPLNTETESQIAQYKENCSSIDFDILVPTAVYHTNKAHALLIAKDKGLNKGHAPCEHPSEPVASTSTATIEPPRSMIWSEKTACDRQVTQIGTSACGATAVVNVFNALGVPVDIERINTAVGTRSRANNASIPSYILSRAVAGCTAADLINGIQIASGGLATARFFPTYPERAMSLSHFLADWISLGAVPILTLNLQNSFEAVIPDAWHHQMVFGVSPQGIYLCNPIECLRESTLWPRLVSPSVLLVKARDVSSRLTEDTDLTPLMYVPDARFHTFNVFGQVANVLRESRLPWRQDSNPRAHYVRIPAAYQAGITIAVLTGSEAHQRLMVASQLPTLDSRCTGSPQNDPA